MAVVSAAIGVLSDLLPTVDSTGCCYGCVCAVKQVMTARKGRLSAMHRSCLRCLFSHFINIVPGTRYNIVQISALGVFRLQPPGNGSMV